MIGIFRTVAAEAAEIREQKHRRVLAALALGAKPREELATPKPTGGEQEHLPQSSLGLPQIRVVKKSKKRRSKKASVSTH